MNKKRFQDISSTFANKSILVVGDIMLDSFMWGVADRISPEAPVPIVSVDTVTHSPGGAGNVAYNLSKLSAKIRIIGLVGNDAESEILTDKLQGAGVDTNYMIKDTSRPTTSAPISIGAASRVAIRMASIMIETTRASVINSSQI